MNGEVPHPPPLESKSGEHVGFFGLQDGSLAQVGAWMWKDQPSSLKEAREAGRAAHLERTGRDLPLLLLLVTVPEDTGNTRAQDWLGREKSGRPWHPSEQTMCFLPYNKIFQVKEGRDVDTDAQISKVHARRL